MQLDEPTEMTIDQFNTAAGTSMDDIVQATVVPDGGISDGD
ncbi:MULTISPECIES: hypothetical protein [unclassified Haloarcula]|nr:MULTISPECIES: hypothetical protein [unclassified Haloarcula]